MKTIIQIFLVVAILVLGYLLVVSINQPIKFKSEQTKRYEKTIERLKDIRTAQLAYRSIYGKFTGSFDTLIHFVKNDSFKVVTQIGNIEDSLAVAQGLIVRDTLLIPVLDSLFGVKYPVDSLRLVPFTGGKEFEIGAGEVTTGSGVVVKVFEVSVHNNVLLGGLDKQLLINLNDERIKRNQFPGLKVGSLEAATNNAGNWE
jgi:hypothetical protein